MTYESEKLKAHRELSKLFDRLECQYQLNRQITVKHKNRETKRYKPVSIPVIVKSR